MSRVTLRDVVLVTAAVCGTFVTYRAWLWWRVPKFGTAYQVVSLTDNNVYIGKIEGLGTRFPVMHDIFYIQTKINPDTKQPSSAIIRRESAWHSPTSMILNANQIVMIEPVGPESRVAKLIEENSKK